MLLLTVILLSSEETCETQETTKFVCQHMCLTVSRLIMQHNLVTRVSPSSSMRGVRMKRDPGYKNVMFGFTLLFGLLDVTNVVFILCSALKTGVRFIIAHVIQSMSLR